MTVPDPALAGQIHTLWMELEAMCKARGWELLTDNEDGSPLIWQGGEGGNAVEWDTLPADMLAVASSFADKQSASFWA